MDTLHHPARGNGLHEPIRRFCGAHEDILGGLQDLRELPQLAAFLERARTSAAATMVLFDGLVRKHHAEEEQELFAAVRRSARDAREGERVRGLVEQLTAEHRDIERLWTKVRGDVARTAAGKPPRRADFDVSVRTLVELYFAHARLEEERFLPLADAILGRNPNHMAALDLALHLREAPAPSPYI